MTNIATNIIKKCGGIYSIGEALRISPTAVSKWQISGLVPAKRQQAILDMAKEKGINLTPNDFFDLPPAGGDEH